uniref:Uncharacterized protein n=1 Tax=Avena sativa TaxID=4498 RepID=A0ACD5ZTV5_AVESA
MVVSPCPKELRSLYQLILNNFHITILLPLIATILLKSIWLSPDKILVWFGALLSAHHFFLTFLPITTITYYAIQRPRAVYLVNYACFRPDSTWRAPMATYIEHKRLEPFFDEGTFHFVKRMLQRSGLGNETCVPPSLRYIPPLHGLSESRAEAQHIIFTVIDDLIMKTGINPNAIDILIVNCSLFNPTPSLADMIVRRYNFRDDIRNMQLSGMGCSAGLIALGLARNLLQTAPSGAHALLVSTEISTGIYYTGKKRSMQLTNALFRTGGAAILLSSSKAKARFEITQIVRKSASTQDNAYRCVFREEDEEGNLGINLSKDLLDIAGKALRDNITTLGPNVLPFSEKFKFLLTFIQRKVLNGRTPLYVPDFRTAFEHFCIHAGGRAVIDGVQQSLCLSNEHAEPSRMTLHRFGNTSSSSVWYELAYSDAKGRIKKGERVWMIGFGSGYKCISVVWKCIQPTQHADMAWADCIHRYPVNL